MMQRSTYYNNEGQRLLAGLSLSISCVFSLFSFHFDHADAAATSLSSRWVLTEDFFPFFFFFISRETAGFIVTLDNILMCTTNQEEPTQHTICFQLKLFVQP